MFTRLVKAEKTATQHKRNVHAMYKYKRDKKDFAWQHCAEICSDFSEFVDLSAVTLI